jgi:hypothetical protein
MIISCPCKKKSFQIDENLIPIEGRNLQCGSCGHVWFFKNEKKNLELKTEIFSNNEIENEEKIQKKVDIDQKDPLDNIISSTDKAFD